jgi:hypothetical protein
MAKSQQLINNLGLKQPDSDGPTVATIEATLKEAARQYTEETINNPSPSDHLLIHNAMLKGWEMGIRHAIAHMREKGITFSG